VGALDVAELSSCSSKAKKAEVRSVVHPAANGVRAFGVGHQVTSH
jgi:hypothetical protein